MEQTKLQLEAQIDGHPHTLVTMGVSVNFYVNASDLQAACSASALAAERYLALLPANTMRSFLASNGFFKDVTPRTISKDLSALRKLPAGFDGYTLTYSSELYGQAGQFGLMIKMLSPSASAPMRASLIRMALPLEYVDEANVEGLVKVFGEMLELLPVDSADAGIAFIRASAMERESIRFIAPQLSRFIAVDPGEHAFTRRLLGSTYSVRWLNYVSSELASSLAGIDDIERSEARAVGRLRNGVLLRSSRRPGFGDAHLGAKDIGRMPSVARALSARRIQDCRFAYTDFDAGLWLARLDHLQDQPWD